MPVSPFCKPAYHRVSRRSKMDPQARPCIFLKFEYNHGSDCFKIMDAETGRFVRHMAPAAGTAHFPGPDSRIGVLYLSSGAEIPDYVYIQPTSAATATPAAAPTTIAPVPASAVAAPAPLSNPPASVPDRVVRERGTRWTCVCLDAREARRAQWGTHTTAWV